MQTREGAKKAVQTILKKDPDFFKKIGSTGGKNSSKKLGNAGGFAANPELAKKAGRLGGLRSRKK